jgi:hypothetical protein
MLWVTSPVVGLVLPTAGMVCLAATMLSTTLSTSCMLHQDGGSYDAGIATSSTTSTSYCRDSYSILLVLLSHEVLLVCGVPQVPGVHIHCTSSGSTVYGIPTTILGTVWLLPLYYLPVHGPTAYTESGVMVHVALQRIHTYHM